MVPSRFVSPLVLVVAALAPATAQDPFSSSERWFAAPAGSDAWMPEDTVFAGDDAFVWTGVRGQGASLLLFDAVEADRADPRGVVPPLAGQFGPPLVAAGTRGDAVFALVQTEAPTAFRRAPLVSAYDPRTVSGGGVLDELWSHDLGVRINGPARLATDARGERVVAAAWDGSTALARVDVLDGTTGALLGRVDLPAIGLSALAVSDDGARIALTAGMTLYVLDADANLVHTSALPAATHALDLSADGGALAHGAFGRVEVLVELPGFGYSPFASAPGKSTELPSRLAISDDGSMLAIGWWSASNGVDARLEIYDLIFGFALASHDLPAPNGATQNLVTAARLTGDGRRAAFATWGNGSDPEVIVLDVGGFGPTLVLNAPGSARCLALDGSGARIAYGHKDVHASTFGSTGALRLVDTGERPLQLLETPRLGGQLVAAARLPGSSLGWFALGPRSDTPLTFPGVTGALLLERGRMQLHARVPDATGRIDLVLPLPAAPALRGMQVHVQAAFRTPSGLALTPNLLSPYLLD
ncbi:MAG: hypothetical protein AAGI22_20580 [Planctomycetota bacterium]